MDLVEKIGSGILRINKAMKEYALPKPKIETDEHWFSIIFKRKVSENSEKIIGDDQKSSEKSSEKILRLIAENSAISAKELAEKVGISPRAVEKSIEKLKQGERVRRVGPDKGGYWEIMKK